MWHQVQDSLILNNMAMQDYEHLHITKDSLLNTYIRFHTASTTDEDFKFLVSMGRIFLASENYFENTFTYFNFFGFLKDFLKNSKVRLTAKEAALFKDLQKAYQKLEKYGIRLWKHPWRREFYTIKLFTTFFKLEIESKDPKAASILELYGFKEKSKNIVELPKSPDLDRICLVSFELFLSTIELEILFDVANNVEDYAEYFSLNSVLRARRKVNGDVDEVVEYLIKEKGLIRAKKIKTEDDKSTLLDTIGKKSNRDTKYPPSSDNRSESSDNHGFSSANSKTIVQHLGSSLSIVDNLSDSELYGHSNASPPNIYIDMGSDIVEDTDTSLPQPLQADSVHHQGIPPPTYYQAIQIPGTDYVVVEKQDSKAGFSAGTSSTIPDVSYINICENGQEIPASRVGSGAWKQGEYSAYDIPSTVFKTAIDEIYSSASHYQAPQNEATKLRASSSSVPKVDSDMVKRRADKYTSTAKGVSTTELYEPPLHSVEKPGGLSKSKNDLERKNISSYDTKPKDRLYSKVIAGSKDSTDVSRTAVSYTTSSNSKGNTSVVSSSYKTQSTVTTRSQARKLESRQHSQEDSETAGITTERYSVDNCNVCYNHVAPYSCEVCMKRFCKDCVNVVTRLLCDDYREEHRLVKASENATKEKGQASKKQDYSTCSYCGTKMPSLYCIYCNIKSCEKCCTRYRKDVCVSNNFQAHLFMDQQQQKQTSEVTEFSTQRQAKPASKENAPNLASHINGENVCDFCGLAANLICKPCLKPICDTCLYAYKQDLCPPTKKEHQFENILMQSNQTTGQGSDSPWECERCTFLNSPSHRICAVCATSRGNRVELLPKSGSRKCSYCTFGNEEGATVCKMCSCTFGLDKPESYI